MNDQLQHIMDLDDKYYLGVFGKRSPVSFTHGNGIYLYDTDNKSYMDMIGGIAVNALGHSHPKLTQAIADQSQKLIHCSNYYYIEAQSLLAEKLVNLSFADKVFFCNSGAEANEAALKLARGYFYHKGSPRTKIVSALKSFHGRTMATISATGQDKFRTPFGPTVPGFTYVPFNDIAALKAEVDETTCAVILEPIQGESGVFPADKAYFQAARELCDATGALLIVDEIQTGIGRTGSLFAHEQLGVTPDILTSAKGLAGGVPIGAMLTTDEVATGFHIGDHGSTFGGNPLACRASLTVLEVICEEHLLENVNSVGIYLKNALEELMITTPLISEVRGMGLLIGIGFNSPIAAEVKALCLENGLLVGSIGADTIRLAPPLILTISEAQLFVSTFSRLIKTIQ